MTDVATPQKRTCGICGRALSTYNKNDFCNSHPPEEILNYNRRMEDYSKGNRELRSFVSQFHKAGTVDDMFAEAAKPAHQARARISPTELSQYHEGLCLVRIASLAFHLSMPGILRLSSTSRTARLVRDVLAYLMHEKLEMSLEEICTFFGYQYPPAVVAAIGRMKGLMLDDEDMILAADLILREFESESAEYKD